MTSPLAVGGRFVGYFYVSGLHNFVLCFAWTCVIVFGRPHVRHSWFNWYILVSQTFYCLADSAIKISLESDQGLRSSCHVDTHNAFQECHEYNFRVTSISWESCDRWYDQYLANQQKISKWLHCVSFALDKVLLAEIHYVDFYLVSIRNL